MPSKRENEPRNLLPCIFAYMSFLIGEILRERQADGRPGVVEPDLPAQLDEGQVEVDAVVALVDGHGGHGEPLLVLVAAGDLGGVVDADPGGDVVLEL